MEGRELFIRVREKYFYMLQAIGLCLAERILPPVDNIIWHFGGWEEMVRWVPGVLLRWVQHFSSQLGKKEEDRRLWMKPRGPSMLGSWRDMSFQRSQGPKLPF